MKGKVVDLFPPAVDPHMTGEAFCIGCGHEWTAVAPQGTTRLQCPACEAMIGLFRFECIPQAPIRFCECGNSLFYLTEHGHLCANCGEYQRYD